MTERERVLALCPRVDHELVFDANPLELGLRAAIADNKGCYPGQEVIEKIISLGSPHMGAPLEQAVHVASYAANLLPETRMYSTFLRRRSSGIRDLRRGSLVDEDWRDRDPEALRAAACEEVPLLEGATHCFVSATVTRSARHPVGRVVGDTLVLKPSASGRSRTRKLGFEARRAPVR